MASYLDNLTQYTSKAQVVIAGLSLEAANIIDNNGNAFQQVDNINWYTMLLEGANDVTLNEELRLQLLTILVDNARLNEVPLVNVFGLYQTLGNTTISASEWGLITGDINNQLDLIAKFNTYLPLAGGTMTGNILFGDDELGIDVLNEGDTLNIGASSGVVQFGLDGVAKFNVIDEGAWLASNIGVLYGGLGNLDFASGTNGQAIVKSGGGYAFATLSGGDVVGTAPSVNNTVVRWDGVTGKLIQGSVVSISDGGSIQAASEISFNGSTSGFTAIVPSAIAGSGTQTLQNATGNIALNINRLDYFAATTSAQLASVISDETGTGLLVFNNTPTFITPILGVASGTSLSVTGGVTSGDAGDTAGTLVLKNSTNAFTQTIRGTSPGGASRIFDLPTSDPSGTQYLSGTIVGSTVTLAWSTLSALTNPMTTVGDIIYGGTVISGVATPTRLGANTSATNRFLRSVSSGNPSWQLLVAGDIPNIAISQVTNLQTILDQRLTDNLPSGQIFVGNLSDLAAGVTPSGDWTIDTTGVATIEPNAVTFDKFIQATGPQILVGTPDILGAQDFRQITLDPLTLQIDALGVMSSIAVGTGTVTNTGTLTLNSLVLGNGGTDVKVGNGFTTDGVSQLTLGVIGSSVGGLLLTNLTSGTIELRPVTGALGTTVLTLFAGSDTLVGLAATQTLTNKTLTAPQINGALLETTSTVGYVWTATNTTGAGSWQVAGGGGGSGTVASVSVVSANGFAGTVATPTVTPAITLTTSITGLLKGNGGALVAATAGTDYVAPGAIISSGLTMSTAKMLGRTTASTGAIEEITIGTGLSFSAGTLSNTGVTSVGLTMPAAFTVTPSTTNPITTSGTFAVTGAGTVSQYVRGDGTLANFPTSGGGGSSLSYYLNGSVAQFGTYKQMNRVPVNGAGTNFTLNNTTGYQLMAQFVTDANDPSLLNIPAGAWDISFYFSSSNNTGNPAFYVELLKYDGTTFTTIANNSANAEIISNGTAVDLYNTSIAVSSTSLTITDRLVIRVYVDTAGSRTITFHTEDNNLAQIITTFTTGLTALNGLTAQVQFFGAVGTTGTAPAWTSTTATHTLNIPLASASSVTAGLISKTEYDTFNGKMSNPMTTLGDIIYGGTVVGGIAPPTRLGIGTANQVLAVSAGLIPEWKTIAAGGDVTGPASATDGDFVIFSGTSGKIIAEPSNASLSLSGRATFNDGVDIGVSSATTGTMVFRNSANAFTTTIQASTSAAASLNYYWPTVAPTAGQILSSDASGNLSWTAAGAGNMVLASPQTNTGAKIFNSGTFILAGATSGTTILNAASTASGTITLPNLTGTVALLENAQTFTGAKTFSAAATFSSSPAAATTVSISPTAGSLTNAQLTIGGTTIQWMLFGVNTANIPAVGTRSSGTKIVFANAISATYPDTSIGYGQTSGGTNFGYIWHSASQGHRFWAGNNSTGSFANVVNIVNDTTVAGLSFVPAFSATVPIIFTNNGWMSLSGAPGTFVGALPTYTNRSAGTRIVTSPTLSATTLDTGIGFAQVGGTGANFSIQWYSAPRAHYFYAGVTTLVIPAIIDSTSLQLATAVDIVLASSGAGTKIGTGTNQLLAFWNKTPIIQPTTGITPAGRVGGVGTPVTTTDTYGGYTLAQIAAALINTGILA